MGTTRAGSIDGREVDEDGLRSPASSVPTSSASRVLPVPPGPVSVTSRISRRARSAVDGRELELAADTASWRPGGTGLRRAVAAGAARRGRVLSEDLLLERAQLGGRLEAELVEGVAGVAVRGERVCLAAGAVEGEHLLGAESLAVGVGGDERLELGGERRVVSCLEVEVDACLERGEARLLEPGSLRRGERLVGDVGERGAAPERERLAGRPAATSRSKRTASSSPSSTRTR